MFLIGSSCTSTHPILPQPYQMPAKASHPCNKQDFCSLTTARDWHRSMEPVASLEPVPAPPAPASTRADPALCSDFLPAWGHSEWQILLPSKNPSTLLSDLAVPHNRDYDFWFLLRSPPPAASLNRFTHFPHWSTPFPAPQVPWQTPDKMHKLTKSS